MRWLLLGALSLTILLVGTTTSAQEDPKDAEIRMLRASAKHASEELAPLQAKVRAQASTITGLVDKQHQLESQLESERRELKSQITTLQAELDRLRAILNPRSTLTSADGIPAVSSVQLSTLGEKFRDKKVKMLNCTFRGAQNVWVNQIPGVTIATDGLVSRIDTEQRNRWIGFFVDDSDSQLFQYCFASKKDFGDILALMKRGTRLNLAGTVIALDQSSEHGLICDTIERATDGSTSRSSK